MNRIKIFYLTVIPLLLICTACNFQQSVSESAGNITPSATINVVTPTNTLLPTSSPSPKLASTATPSPTSTPIPTPTLGPVDQQAIELLNLSEEEYCSEVYSYQCHTIIKTKILDYLYQYPNSFYRQKLLDKTLEFGLWINPQWIIEDWLRKTVSEIAESPDTSEKINEFEDKWGQIIITDLDDNGETDYVVAIQQYDSSCESFGQMYWVYQTDGNYQVELLPTTTYDFDRESMYPMVLSTDDLTGDGLPELAYVAISCGPTDQLQRPRVLSWQDGQFIDRLIEQWYLVNGDLTVKEKNEEGIAELIITQGKTANAGFAPYSSYQVDLELQRDEYIPVKQTSLFQLDIQPGDEDILYWQWANFLLHTNRYAEAIDVFSTIAIEPASYFVWADYRPYALFRMGLAYLLLDEQTAAQNSWERLTKKFPDHPISIDLMVLRNMLRNRNDLGEVCTWLQKNGQRWGQPQWAASESALAFTKWRLYQYEEQGKMDYQKWMASQEPFDYDQARRELESIDGPQDYGRLTGWQDLCHPMFLVALYDWKQDEKIETQMKQLGLAWETLSTEYDLNNDAISDPIGVWKTEEKLYLWSFISQDDTYHPLSVTQPYPIEAINIWEVTDYKYGGRYFLPETEFIVTDPNNDTLPEVLANGNYYEGEYRWLGHRFEYEPSARVSQPDNSPDPLIEALTALFRDRDHQHTLELLHQYSPANEWEEATQLYLQALAFQYSDQPEQANVAFKKIINNYPDTGWSLLAREKLGYNGN